MKIIVCFHSENIEKKNHDKLDCVYFSMKNIYIKVENP